MQWMVDSGMAVNEGNNSFPNIGGVGSNSLAVISPYLKDMDWAKVYRYVPGLRQNDPDGLVMMYMDRPTRWIWHGQTPTIFRAKAWLVVPVDFREGIGSNSIAPGELSSCVSTVEFKRRLKATLDFIHTNQRPNWQAIVAEHSKFLEGIEGLAK